LFDKEVEKTHFLGLIATLPSEDGHGDHKENCSDQGTEYTKNKHMLQTVIRVHPIEINDLFTGIHICEVTTKKIIITPDKFAFVHPWKHTRYLKF